MNIKFKRPLKPGEPYYEEVQRARDELLKVTEYLEKIFQEIGCMNRNHVNKVTSICTYSNCKTTFLCSQCLVENSDHTTEHKQHIAPIKKVLEKIFLDNLEDYVIKDYKMVQVNKFYDLFWKGIKRFYKEQYESFVDKIRETMKKIYDGFTEAVVQTKNQILEKFDKEMRDIKEMVDEGVNIINDFNSFNVESVVKRILTHCTDNKVDELVADLRRLLDSKTHNDLNDLPVKLYKSIMELREEVQYKDYTPQVNFNSEKLAKSLVEIFKKGITKYIKFEPPAKKLSWSKATKNHQEILEEKGFSKGLSTMNTSKLFTGLEEGTKGREDTLLSARVNIFNGKKALYSYEYPLSQFDKLVEEMGLYPFRQGNQFNFTRLSDKKSLRRVLFKRMFPDKPYEKKWVMKVVVPKKRRKRPSTSSDIPDLDNTSVEDELESARKTSIMSTVDGSLKEPVI